MAEEPSIEQLIALARGRMPADEAAALRARIASQAEWRDAAETISRAVEVLDADAGGLPPVEAIARAKSLGRRLASLRPASLVERIGESIARLVRDTRLDAGLAGLRGTAGFACSFAAGNDELEIECAEDRSGRFRLAGQVSGEGWQSVAFAAARGGSTVSAEIDADGMFAAIVAPGSYVVTVRARDGRLVTIEELEIP
jgi:hypothetical protein